MMKNIIICDIDGTVAAIGERRKHLPNWNKFFQGMENDKVIPATKTLLKAMHDSDHLIYFVSGRPEEYKSVTRDWIMRELEFCSAFVLLMRKTGDYRSDVIVKQEMLNLINKEDIVFVIDDRPEVVRMWRKNGLTCYQINNDWEKRLAKLHLMIGPSGAGKSFWLREHVNGGDVVSSDDIRVNLFGTIRNQSGNDVVFKAVHSLIGLRLSLGLETWVDATNLNKRDRMACISVAPKGTEVEYWVIDRSYERKVRGGEWRNEVVMKNGQTLIQYHEEKFKKELENIVGGDGGMAEVHDLRNYE